MKRAALLALALGGCVSAPPNPRPLDHYRTQTSWLCVPGRDDACTRDLTATEIHPDGSRTVERFQPAAAPKADCFYVYPTVDMGLTAYNHEDFSDLEPIADVTLAQAARLRESCALYVPLYRQVSIGTYFRAHDIRERGLAAASRDVEAAFGEYLATYNRGRPIVIIGHSQGADMVTRLLRRFFDGPDQAAAELRSRLLVALSIGWIVDVAASKTTGGTFERVPMCTRDDETGCFVAFRSYEAAASVDPGDDYLPPTGRTTACVNPADVAGNTRRTFTRSYFPMLPHLKARLRDAQDVKTPFVVYRDLYTGQCAEGPGGFRYLAIAVTPGRQNPYDFDRLSMKKRLGLHILDLQLPQGDVLGLVARRVAAAAPSE